MGTGEQTHLTVNLEVTRRVPDVLVTPACIGRDCKRLANLVTHEAMDMAADEVAPPSVSHVIIACPGAAYLLCRAQIVDEGSTSFDELGKTDQDYIHEARATGATQQTATDYWRNRR